MKKILALVCVLVLALGCFAMAEEKTYNAWIDQNNEFIAGCAGKRIGIANIYLGDEWCKAVADGFSEYAEIYGFEVNNQDGNLDHDTQAKQIEQFITMQYDMILCDAANGEGIADILDEARDAGIPVVCYDANSVWDYKVAQVGTDNYGNGVKIGEMVKKYIEENLGGEAKIVILSLYQPHTILREEGFHSVIDQMPGVEVITTQDSNGNRETAANIITAIAEDYDIIYSVVPNGGLGAIAALETLGKDPSSVKVFMPVSSEETYQMLRDEAAGKEGFLVGGTGSDGRLCSTRTLEAAGRYFLGIEQEVEQVYDSIELTAENINEYYPAAE